LAITFHCHCTGNHEGRTIDVFSSAAICTWDAWASSMDVLKGKTKERRQANFELHHAH
jgi:hypothetical protein